MDYNEVAPDEQQMFLYNPCIYSAINPLN